MPTVNLNRDEFFARLGRTYGTLLLARRKKADEQYLAFKEFDELLFEYGLELDEDVRPPPHPTDSVEPADGFQRIDHDGSESSQARAASAQD